MPSTDDRVVAMHFDNAAFERKVAETIASMEKLKTTLDFTNSSKGLADLKTAGNNIDFSHMANAVEGLSSKFSAMGAVAFSVINNIVNRAVDASIQLGKSLSLDQAIGGFQEYETNMNSIQTILANTRSDGTSLDQVSAALEELNLYSDKTIYNFSQMARNIGTFTAAGVSLETSTGAIKGIANLAAVSGSNAEQASTAMYQLSQALASGSLKLMDWNSVVNAGMGGEVFQKALFETGKALGTIKDVPLDQTFEQWKDAGNTFRATLEQGWVTGEVLTNTLAGFTGDLTEAQVLSMGYTKEQAAEILAMGVVAQDAATKVKTLTQLIGTIKESIGSGWAQTFKIIFGDFEEARTLFTGFSEYFGGLASASAEARNKLFAGWERMGGRLQLIETIMYAVQALTKFLRPLQDAFREIFPKKTASDLFFMTRNLRDFMASLEITGKQSYQLKRIFTGLFSAIKIGWEIVKGVLGVFKTFFKAIFDAVSASAGNKGILGFLAELADKITLLREKLIDGGGIAKFFEELGPKVANFATTMVDKFKEMYAAVKNFIGFFTDGFSGAGTNEGEGIHLFANRLGMVVGKIKDFFKELIDWHQILDDAFNGTLTNDESANSAGPIKTAEALGEAFRKARDFLKEAAETLGEIKDKVVNFFKDFTGNVGESAGGIFEKIFGKDAEEDVKKIEGFGDKLGKAGDKIKGFKDKIDEFATGGGKGRFVQAFKFDKDDAKTIEDTSSALGGLGDAFQGVWDKITSGIGDVKTKLDEFLAFIQDLVSGSDDVTKAATKSANKGLKGPKSGDSIGKTSKGGDGFDIGAGDAAAGGILAGILLIFRDLRKLIPDVKGLFKDVGKSVQEITNVFEAMQLKLKAEALKEIGKAIALITASMVVLSLMDTTALITAATAVGVVVAQLVGAMALLSKFATGASSTAKIGVMAASMVAMAGSVLLMSVAAKLMSTIDMDALVKGVGSIMVLLFAMTKASKSMDKVSVKGGLGMILIATAMKRLASAVEAFSGMSWPDLIKGMIGLTVALFLLVDVIEGLPGGAELLRSGAGILLIALAADALAVAVKIFATMDLLDMGKGLLGLAAAIGIMVLAVNNLPQGQVLASAAAILIMAFALQILATTLGVIAALSTDDMVDALLGLGIALGILVGAAVLMQYGLAGALAIAILSVSLTSLAKAMQMFADIGWGELLGGLAKLAVTLGALALIAYLIAPAALAMAALGIALLALGAGMALIGIGAKLFAEAFQIVVNAGGDGVRILMEILDGLIARIPEFVGAVADGLLLLAQKILDAAPALIGGFSKLLEALLQAGIDLIPKFVEFMGVLLEGMLEVVRLHQDAIIEAGFQLLMSFLQGIEDHITEIVDTVLDIITKFITEVAAHAQELVASGLALLTEFLKGIANNLGQVIDAAGDIIAEMVEGFGRNIHKILRAGKDAIVEFIKGVGEMATDVAQAATDTIIAFATALGENVLELINATAEIILNVLNGIADAIETYAPQFRSAGLRIAEAILDGATFGLYGKAKDLVGAVFGTDVQGTMETGVKKNVTDPIKKSFTKQMEIGSPSKVFMRYGQNMMDGLLIGINDGSNGVSKGLVANLNDSMAKVGDILNQGVDFNPTIAPILDLTNVERSAARLSGILGAGSTMTAELTYAQTAALASTSSDGDTVTGPTPIKQIKFEQNNYSPEALSNSDIYRQTRNQITMAKEVLAVL